MKLAVEIDHWPLQTDPDFYVARKEVGLLSKENSQLRARSTSRKNLVIHDEIKRRLERAGVTFSGRSPSYITMVCQGVRDNTEIEKLIAKKLNTTREDLWPNKFDKKDLPEEMFKVRFNTSEIRDLKADGIIAVRSESE